MQNPERKEVSRRCIQRWQPPMTVPGAAAAAAGERRPALPPNPEVLKQNLAAPRRMEVEKSDPCYSSVGSTGVGDKGLRGTSVCPDYHCPCLPCIIHTKVQMLHTGIYLNQDLKLSMLKQSWWWRKQSLNSLAAGCASQAQTLF